MFLQKTIITKTNLKQMDNSKKYDLKIENILENILRNQMLQITQKMRKVKLYW